MSDRATRRARHRAWGVSWLAYASYYLGRKGLSVTKKTLEADLGISAYGLATIDTAFLLFYAVGQFVNGYLGDRWGARRLLVVGLCASALACTGFGLSQSLGLFVAFFALNGFAQASGWPGATRAMAEWTETANRGTVMGVWATCYQVGGIVATVLATWLLVHYSWRASFLVPAAWLVGIALVVAVGLPSEAQRDRQKQAREQLSAAASLEWAGAERPASPLSSHPFRSPRLWAYGTSYFCIKLIRYSLLFWLPYYLAESQGMGTALAGYASTAFEIGGIVGVIVLGYLSDRLWQGRRALSAICSLLLLSICLFLLAADATQGTVLVSVALALVGATLFGPDALISGAAAQEVVGTEHAAKATGFVNGMGSLGAILQGPVTVTVSERWGWQNLFLVFLGLALLAGVCLLPTLGRSSARPPGG